MTNTSLYKLALEYINTEKSIKEIANDYGISKTTLIRYFNGEHNSIKLPPDIQELVDQKKNENWINSKSTNGNQGNFSKTDSEIVLIAKQYLTDNFTLEELAKHHNISTSTLYNLFTPEHLEEKLYNRVLEMYERHKKYGVDSEEKSK